MIRRWLAALLEFTLVATATAAENVLLTNVPDYAWYAGCFGTAAGNLMGYWDRSGFPDFYTGPTAEGVAPLNSDGSNAGIRSLWASRAGFDGRPANQPGHVDNYWTFYFDDLQLSYESTAPDPFTVAGRPEHPPDCISDFIGASQNKWKNLNGEHDGNIDAYAVVIWDLNGDRRVNFEPPPQEGQAVRDIPSGLRAWTRHRGYDADVFSQLTDFNPQTPAGKGFTFDDLKAEIDAGFPVILFLQNPHEKFRVLPGMPKANPNVHGMLAYGYYISDGGLRYVRYKTSWGGSGENRMRLWNHQIWEAELPVRGVIGYRPLPKITRVIRHSDTLEIQWHGPSATLWNLAEGMSTKLHQYVVEQAPVLAPDAFKPLTEPTTDLHASVPTPDRTPVYFRIRLLEGR